MKPTILSNSEVGTHAGNITKLASEPIDTKYLLGTLDVNGTHVKIAGSSDLPIGVITDEASAKDDVVNVALLGGPDTLKAVASEAITVGSKICPSDGGKVKAFAGAPGTNKMIGIALTAAYGDGKIIEFVSCVPQTGE